MSDTRKCETCEQVKPIEDFRRSASGPDGRAMECKHCRKVNYGVAPAKKPKTKPPPKRADAPEPPAFLAIETQETYVINASDGAAVALTGDELDALCAWWKAKGRTK